jgi:guanylate kinase
MCSDRLAKRKDSKVLIISAPSGAGKTTLVHHLLSAGLPLMFSVSATSRKPRGSEVNGREYYFISSAEFRKKIRNGEFIEWQEVYRDHYYGTLRSEIDRIAGENKIPLFDLDVQGGINLKKIFGERALAVFIMPPSIDELRSRLVKRGTDSPEKIEMRVEKASSEILLADEFDRIIINDGLGKACEEVLAVVTEFIRQK